MTTAKELFDKMLEENDECTSTEMMIEFAKLHVERALQKAYKEARIELEDGSKVFCFGYATTKEYKSGEINKHSITNSYPLENIK